MNLTEMEFNTSAFTFFVLLQGSCFCAEFLVLECASAITVTKTTFISKSILNMNQKFSFFVCIKKLCANSKESEVPF